METYLKEPIQKHPDISVPVKVVQVYWATNEAYVQGVEERVFVTEASNLTFKRDGEN